MQRIRRMVVYGILGLAVLVVLGGCAWIFYAQNVEQPEYVTERAAGPIEIRAYPELVVAEVTRPGQRYDAVRNGFGPLARYIFAREREGEAIAMTAPVTQRADQPDGAWSVQFIMPAQYTLEDLPNPANADVALRRLPAQRRAAIRFSGVATDGLIAEQEALLRDWMAGQGLAPLEPPIYAYYNDPWTPGILRRNEVLFDLR